MSIAETVLTRTKLRQERHGRESDKRRPAHAFSLTSWTAFKNPSKSEALPHFLPTCSKYQTLVLLGNLRVLHVGSGS